MLGLRDIIDAPPVVRRAWRQVGAYDYLPAYESVMVYGNRTIFDASSAYQLGKVARSVVYCDYVSTRPSGTGTRARRAPYVLMLGGGGGDAFPLADAFVDALKTLNGELGLYAVMMTGPNMDAADRRTLFRRMPRGLRIAAPFDDATPWIRGASAVVSMAGYNSVCELLRWQKKALVVPRRGPSAEQRMRSQLFAQRSLVRLLSPDRLSSATLAAELGGLLDDSEVPDVDGIPSLDGARQAAAMILDPDHAAAQPAACVRVAS
jgi:predicted glycosyltransferase